MKILIPILLGISLLCCTNNKTSFDQKVILDSDNWSYEDHVNFLVSEVDTSQLFELQLILEHTMDYSFENIYLKVFTEFPDLSKRGERLSVDLAHKTGEWKGKCNSESCKLRVYLLEKFKFPQPGSYQFSFEQHSRQDSLPGILSLQMKLIQLDE